MGSASLELKVFTGNSHPQLAKNICEHLGIGLGQADVFKFSNDNTFARILENVRERDVFMVQPTCTSDSGSANDSLMELLIMIDAAKRASAGRITAVVPYYGYGRTDKKDQPRVPITARLVADLITTAGANRLLTIDLHAGQIQGFFNIPVDELSALKVLSNYFKTSTISAEKDLTVVATDIGISKRARNFAEELDSPLAIIEKRRLDNSDNAESLNIIGEIDGKNTLLFDDEVATAGSMTDGAELIATQDSVENVYACATHPVLSGPAVERIEHSSIVKLVVTDTIPLSLAARNSKKIKVVSIAPLLAAAIRNIHEGESVGDLIENPPL